VSVSLGCDVPAASLAWIYICQQEEFLIVSSLSLLSESFSICRRRARAAAAILEKSHFSDAATSCGRRKEFQKPGDELILRLVRPFDKKHIGQSATNGHPVGILGGRISTK
jgi:hypothetical protein